jgi:hypothetical protein
MYKIHSRNFKTPKIKKTWDNRETNKETHRKLQQTSNWNKGHHKRDIWIKEDNTDYTKGVEQRYGKPQKKESNWNSGNKKSLQSNKK